MPPHPTSGLDPSQALGSVTPASDAHAEDISHTDLGALAARFASAGALSPELSADLALEIALNEIVEQACLATGATGAAIVLRRGEEMVCRATNGTTAPTLGSTLDASSGLSNLCLSTRRTQRTHDALTDPNADREASLRLGVRSVMVIPLLQGENRLGIFEVFSSRPAAFGDRDELILEALGSRALANMHQASLVQTNLERAPEAAPPVEVASNQAAIEAADNPDLQSAESTNPATRRLDLLTSFLTAAVLACAVLLGLLVGRRFGFHKTSPRISSTPAIAGAGTASRLAGTQNGSVQSRKAEEAFANPDIPKTRTANPLPAGGLQVYENGKEIFRMPPAREPGTAASDRKLGIQRAASRERETNADRVIELPARAAEGSVLYRVEPEYPEAARQQGIQGAVVLRVHIRADGTVEDVQVESGPPQLTEAAAEAVTRWRFKPHTENGQAARMQTRVTLKFKLPG